MVGSGERFVSATVTSKLQVHPHQLTCQAVVEERFGLALLRDLAACLYSDLDLYFLLDTVLTFVWVVSRTCLREPCAESL